MSRESQVQAQCNAPAHFPRWEMPSAEPTQEALQRLMGSAARVGEGALLEEPSLLPARFDAIELEVAEARLNFSRSCRGSPRVPSSRSHVACKGCRTAQQAPKKYQRFYLGTLLVSLGEEEGEAL